VDNFSDGGMSREADEKHSFSTWRRNLRPSGACALLRFVGCPLRGTLGASNRFAVILLGEEKQDGEIAL
jgi:hypothetical protein